MSRIRVNIERLVLSGFSPSDAQSLSNALQAQLHQALVDPATRRVWARSRRTPVLKLGRMTLQSGPAGAAKLGKLVAGAIRKGLRT